MTQLFRSKSWVLGRNTLFDSVPPSPSLYLSDYDADEEDEGYQEEEEEEEEDDEKGSGCFANPISTPLIVPSARDGGNTRDDDHRQSHQFPILEILVEALRKSLVTCSSVGMREDICSMDISWPTDVRHVSHVTFDRFNGFLGLPVEFEPEIPKKVPSASVSVFGVSAESMQCSYDDRGNSVPTILLMMQRRLYSEGGLRAEGIFRINPENSQEENVRSQLNRGVVPPGLDVHCLAGLIKAWFRELPAGVLDSLTPEQVMHCNTEEECTHLASLLQPTEFALLDWAINLMADIVQHEHQNKMNARNIAMVFAPNMTQMADPLTALFHAVQVMNFLKTLIIKVLREREKSPAEVSLFSSCSESPNNKDNPDLSKSNSDTGDGSCEQATSDCVRDGPPVLGSLPRSSSHGRLDRDSEDIFWSLREKNDAGEDHESICGNSEPSKCHNMYMENECGGRSGSADVEGFSDRISWKEGVRKLCRHPVFQLSRPIKKSAGFGIINI